MSEIVNHIAKKIRELRVAVGLSQSALAAKIKVTPNTVSRWESATYQPRIEDLEILARALGKPIWAFFPSEVEPATEDHQALLSATGDLPPEDIDELIRYAEFVRARHVLRTKRSRSRRAAPGNRGRT